MLPTLRPQSHNHHHTSGLQRLVETETCEHLDRETGKYSRTGIQSITDIDCAYSENSR